jgi:hypothetical protein
MSKISWNISVERGNYDDADHFEAQIRFNEGDSVALADRVQKLLDYLADEEVMDNHNEDVVDYEEDDDLIEEEDYDDADEED